MDKVAQDHITHKHRSQSSHPISIMGMCVFGLLHDCLLETVH